MSIFLRGKGSVAYHDALAATAVNLRRLQDIRRAWRGEQCLVRFDPPTYAEDMRSAAKVCGLTWQDAVYREVFDPICRHHDPTRVDHESQRIFDGIGGLPPRLRPPRRPWPLPGTRPRRKAVPNTFAIPSRPRGAGVAPGDPSGRGCSSMPSSGDGSGSRSHPLYNGALRWLYRFTWKRKLSPTAPFKLAPPHRRRRFRQGCQHTCASAKPRIPGGLGRCRVDGHMQGGKRQGAVRRP